MQVKNPNYRDHIDHIFARAGHIQALGIDLLDVGPGWCETQLFVKPHHSQQTGFVHAGVLATLADHTAGSAGSTLLAIDEYVLTIEFKVNFLRAAQGQRLWCRADVLKPGRMITVAEAEIFAETGEHKKLVAKATVTLAVLKA